MDKKEMSKADREILQRRLKERRLFLNMTYQDLADKTGISKSTLQRYETGGIKNLPYDKIFILSEALEVSPEYFTNLTKDYTGESDYEVKVIRNDTRTKHLAQIKEFEERAIRYITPNLISQGYNIERHSHGSVGDIVAIKGKEVWHIDFLYTRDVSKYPTGMGMGRQQLLLRFGRLAVYDKPITKYSIVMERRELAEQFLRFKPIHLDIETSIIILQGTDYKEFHF
ncbi:helix-turn-helix domain-containing protein [Bacillus tuaregi]|uniref:helix-turn-helix domain-containing protein n=1 Tax=Bacillus tuaregi TaxID=1816695 RepID=UPI0008F9307F|nr:helix-turn-helix transcriptional regulator [Bacillus tuaregi]